MAQLITTHDPIRVVQTKSGNAELMGSYLEHSAESFLGGTPVELSSGYVIPWDGTTITGAILGITALAGENLGTSGAGAPPTFGSIGFPGGSPTIPPHPPNQPNAVNLGDGTPFTTGQTLVSLAVQDSIFRFQVDASGGATYNATTALIGTQLGLTADGNGSWYADLNKSTPSSNTVMLVVGLDPLDFVAGSTTTQINNGHIYGVFLEAATSVNN
jgi:hypothetical protein